MKVLLVNGSPHKEGCTFTALSEVARTLEEEKIETEIFWIGNNISGGCISCGKCAELGKCVLHEAGRLGALSQKSGNDGGLR